MRTKNKITSIALSQTNIEALTALATKHGALSRSGVTTGLPSWRVLIALIADGGLAIGSASPKKAKSKKPFRGHPRFPPGWWQPGEFDDMPTDKAVAASGRTFEELIAGGLLAADAGTALLPGDGWTGWHYKGGEE
jgi:hypothetical protein